ncbi:MAG: glycoside hydrolase family 5 protein [Patescibacteria group bacterium]
MNYLRLFLTFLVTMSVLGTSFVSIGNIKETEYTTNKNRVFENNKEIRLNGVSWFGTEVKDTLMPHGLWSRGYKEMVKQIKFVGFNAIRFPFCPSALKNQNVGYFNQELNKDLVGKKSLEIMDLILKEINDQGLYILLDHHRPDCMSISELWYTDTYSENDWINDLKFVANRYRHLSKFMGIEIKNEPHGRATWSNSRPLTDFNKAAERAGKEILSINSNILIFVGGVGNNPECDSSDPKWWGGNVAPYKCYPLDANSIPLNKTVLSPHVYGPDVSMQPYFVKDRLKKDLPKYWEHDFGQFVPNNTVIVTEFGGFYKPRSLDFEWQNAIVDYFITKKICNSFYWVWNPNSSDTGGILNDDWISINNPKLNNLRRLHRSCELKNGTNNTVAATVNAEDELPTNGVTCTVFGINNTGTASINNWVIKFKTTYSNIQRIDGYNITRYGTNDYFLRPNSNNRKSIPPNTTLDIKVCGLRNNSKIENLIIQIL